MPWKEVDRMSLKQEFVELGKDGAWTIFTSSDSGVL